MTSWAVNTLLATSLLTLVVLLVRKPVGRLFGPRAAYALWLAPALRMLLPPLPDSGPAGSLVVETTIVPGTAAHLPFVAVPGSGLAELIVSVWLGGAALFLAFHITAHHRFVGGALREGRRLNPSAARGPELIESAAVQGPLATGIVRQRILIPIGLRDRLGDHRARLAIAHEELHHRRRDLHALALSLLMLSLHWFNPLAHFAHRAFRRDLEAACDAQLTQDFGTEEREEYARAIIECAAGPVPHAICTLTTIDDLKGRLKMLNWNHGRATRLTGAALAACIVAAGMAVTAQAQTPPATAEKPEKFEIRRIVKDGKVVEEGVPADVRTRLGQCDGEKFEAVADAPADGGKKQHTKISVCAKQGASNAEFATMLEDAVKRLESEGEVRGNNKAQIVAQLRARIAQLRSN